MFMPQVIFVSLRPESGLSEGVCGEYQSLKRKTFHPSLPYDA
jgi:hypothetical protein